MTAMWRLGLLYGSFVNPLEKQPIDTDVSYCFYRRVWHWVPTVRPIFAPESRPLNISQQRGLLGVPPEASITIELLTGAERARLRQRFRTRWALLVCLLLVAACAGRTFYQEVESGASMPVLAGLATFALLSLRWVPNLLRQCRLAQANYRAGIKHVIRGPLLASDRISSARQRRLPRFRWLIGDRLIGIDVNWDFVYIRGLGDRRLRPADCEAMQHPGLMLEAHVTVATGMALYVASVA
jgi:hypothetical protein